MTPDESRQVFTSLGELKAQSRVMSARLDQVVTDLNTFITETRKLWHDEMNRLQNSQGGVEVRLLRLETFQKEIMNNRKTAARWLGLIGLGIGSGIVEAIHWLKGN